MGPLTKELMKEFLGGCRLMDFVAPLACTPIEIWDKDKHDKPIYRGPSFACQKLYRYVDLNTPVYISNNTVVITIDVHTIAKGNSIIWAFDLKGFLEPYSDDTLIEVYCDKSYELLFTGKKINCPNYLFHRCVIDRHTFYEVENNTLRIWVKPPKNK